MNTEINRDAHKLHFKGEVFRLGQLFNLAKTAPVMEVKLAELNLVGITEPAADGEDATRLIAQHSPTLPEYHEQDVVFYKQEGKFTVLFGQTTVKNAVKEGRQIFKGRLVSGPVLKKTRIEAPIDRQEIIRKLQESPPSFNAPRVTHDTRRSSPSYPRRGISDTSNERSTPSHAGERRYSSNETITRRDPKRS